MDPHSTEYDIIFAGAGTTACVVAGRLAAADSTLRILLVENGPLTKDLPLHVQPARYLQNMTDPRAETFTFHKANPSLKLNGRSLTMSNANCVGGGSSVNAMFYNRAAASDYDDWMHAGNHGWGSTDLIPLAKKLETYQVGVVDSTHGSSGPIKVSYGGHEMKVGMDFLVAASGFPRGRGFSEGMNDFSSCDVYGRFPKYIDAENGRRSDAAHFHLYPQAHNPNVRILDNARVNRILFNGDNRAVGIEYHTGDALLTACATRLVVISAGAVCSPAILERSGIGRRELLQRLGIPVISDLPGVGENYKDHHATMPCYLAPKEEVMMNNLAQDKDGVFEAQWLRDGKGLMAANGLDTAVKLRPNAQDLAQIGPVFAQRWATFFADAPDKCTVFVSPWAAYLGDSPPTTHTAFGVSYVLMHPMAEGSIHVRAADAFAPLEIHTGLLDRDEDVVLMRWAYKWSRELARRMDSFRGEYALAHPKFPGESDAKCGEADGPVDMAAPEIQYSPADDEAIDTFHRANAALWWHALGTCAMKPRDKSGVVDSQLNVYGVKNLKLADMSIAPSNVGANTYNTALIIGEKAAILIAEELGINIQKN
ncbi:GMC oxidoreductase-domain-containing protein [Mycena polygramma]|nr:GMC oxidoreductase-domain-containing protein [Mycena polygramma]